MSIKTRIQLRRGNLADLPTLAAGEPGFTLDTYQLYIGDGVSNHLVSGSSGSAGGGDMYKAAYDPDLDNSVELADAILGGSAAGNHKYYGTNASGVLSFYDVIPATRQVATASTSGLNGGGALSTDLNLVLDVSRLTAQLGSIASDDYLPIWNTSGPNMRKIAWTYFLLDVATNTKLDDLAAPDDNTDLNASTSKHGLLKKLDNVSTHFLDGQGNWSTPSGGGSSSGGDKYPAEGYLTLIANVTELYYGESNTPSATDTTNNYVDFAAVHGWVTGQIVAVITTGGGLTANTKYYARLRNTTSIYFYDTLAHALAGGATGLIDLTASVTNPIYNMGVGATTLNYSPDKGDQFACYDGVSAWTTLTFANLELDISALTANLLYDIYGYNNSGALAIEALAWSSATARATDIVLVNGVKCKSGATTRRYIGTILISAVTGQVLMDFGNVPIINGSNAMLGIYNEYNQKDYKFSSVEATDSWAYATATMRAKNNSTGNRFTFVNGGYMAVAAMGVAAFGSATLVGVSGGFGEDSTSVRSGPSGYAMTATNAGIICQLAFMYGRNMPIGSHFLQELEYGNTGVTWYGDAAVPTVVQSGSIYSCRG